MKNKIFLGTLGALIANVIFGFSFLFSKLALEVAHPLVIISVRFTVAFIILNILWAFGVFKLNFKGKPKKKILLMAVAQPLLYFIFELYGIDNSSSAISGVIISLVPIAVIILSAVVLREKPTIIQIIFSLISLVAVGIISIFSNDGNTSSTLGILLLLGAVICAAVFNILSRSESAHYSPFERTYIMFLISTVGFNIISLCALRGNYIPQMVSAVQSTNFWWAIGYLAILSSIGAFMLYNYATSVIDTVRAASFSNLITVVSVLAGIFIMKENLSALQVICCAFIILGVFGTNLRLKNKE
ncbi:MAG: DMT family transporter [Clostridia bacterium]|nr:DMT family transporter [Clostridia bacterium]